MPDLNHEPIFGRNARFVQRNPNVRATFILNRNLGAKKNKKTSKQASIQYKPKINREIRALVTIVAYYVEAKLSGESGQDLSEQQLFEIKCTAAASLFFLRFINPALTSPHVYSIVKSEPVILSQKKKFFYFIAIRQEKQTNKQTNKPS